MGADGDRRVFSNKKPGTGLKEFMTRRATRITAMLTKREYDDVKDVYHRVLTDGYFKTKDGKLPYPTDKFEDFQSSLLLMLNNGKYERALNFANKKFNGSLLVETKDKVVGIRTASGYKQMFLAKFTDEENDFNVLSSEDCINVSFQNRDPQRSRNRSEFQGMDVRSELLKEGEIVVLGKDSVTRIESRRDSDGLEVQRGYDHHEAIYTLHNNSTWNGRSVNSLRKRLGANIRRLYPEVFEKADIVSYVPDDPIPIALGAVMGGIGKFDEVLQKNRYEGGKQQRDYAYLHKNVKPNFGLTDEGMVAGKNVVLVDDSVIRAGHVNAVRKILGRICSEVHMVSAEVPIIDQRQVGIYTQNINSDLIAKNVTEESAPKSIEDFNRAMSKWSEISVHYNTLSSIAGALEVKPEYLDVPGLIRAAAA